MDNVAKWREDSAGNALVLNLKAKGFTQISDPDGLTMKRIDDNGVVCYVSRTGRYATLAAVPARVAFKYLKGDGVYRNITPSGCDMTEELWTMFTNTRNNYDILEASV